MFVTIDVLKIDRSKLVNFLQLRNASLINLNLVALKVDILIDSKFFILANK